jgi:hypothetical protein
MGQKLVQHTNTMDNCQNFQSKTTAVPWKQKLKTKHNMAPLNNMTETELHNDIIPLR